MGKHKTKVIFRKFKEGDVIALFPELLGKMNPATCMSFMHVGQHGAASVNVVDITKPAKPDEYAALQRELETIGYNLRIVKRLTRGDYETRQDELNRMRGKK